LRQNTFKIDASNNLAKHHALESRAGSVRMQIKFLLPDRKWCRSKSLANHSYDIIVKHRTYLSFGLLFTLVKMNRMW